MDLSLTFYFTSHIRLTLLVEVCLSETGLGLINLILLCNVYISLSCRFDYPQPTFQKLMKEHIMEPFFVFQVVFSQLSLSLSLIFSFLLYVCMQFFTLLLPWFFSLLACRSSVWVSGVWMNIGIIVCSPCSCCLCLSQQWQKVG